MALLSKRTLQTLASQSTLTNPSSAARADYVEEDILPQSRTVHERPAPAENVLTGEDQTESQHRPRSPHVTPLIRLRTNQIAHRRFQVLQQFEGVVLEILEDGFVAQLSDLTNADNAEEFAELPLEEISPADRPLLVPGCIFYWILGYETRQGGQIIRVSEIRLQRSPPRSRRSVEAAWAKARETLNSLNTDGKKPTQD